MALGCCWTKKQTDSRTVYLQRKKYVCGWKAHFRFNPYSRKASSFYRRGGIRCPQMCRFLKLRHHIHSSFEKSLIERTMQYTKDRTEGFDDYFPCRKVNCKLKHVKNWLNLFVFQHNKDIVTKVNRAKFV